MRLPTNRCTLSTDKERRKALETLPLDLFETYRRILSRVSRSTRGNRRMVERTLRWVLLAGGSIPADALPTAVAIEIGESHLDPDDIPDERSMLKWCSSLLTKDDKLNTITFSHFTVREFLADPKLLEFDELRDFYLDVNPSQVIATKVCLKYICMPEFSHWIVNSYDEIKQRLVELPFLEYACQWWTDHADASRVDESGNINDHVLFQLMCRLFHPIKSSNFILWVNIDWTLGYEGGRQTGRAVPIPLTSTLHHATSLGYADICKWLIDQGMNVNSFDPILGTPLLCAVANYYRAWPEKLNVLKILLLHGAHAGDDIDFTREMLRGFELPYGNPMTMVLDKAKQHPDWACEMFRELLTTCEVSSFAKSSFWSIPPAYRGPPAHTYSSQPALPPYSPSPHYIDIDIPPPPPRRLGTFPNPELISKKMVNLFREILDHKALSLVDGESKAKLLSYLIENDKGESGHKALSGQLAQENMTNSTISTQVAQVAAKNGQVDLIKSFIQGRSDPQILASCLPVAANSGYATIVEMLLEYCLPHVSRTSENIRKAWICSALAGNTASLAICVKHGLDTNMIVEVYDQPPFGLNRGTAIANAVSCGMLDAVKYLLEFPGPHLHIRADDLPLLHLAARAPKNRKEMIELFLEKGLDPKERSDRGTSILHHLLVNPNDLNTNDLETARMLVGKGCDLEAVDNDGFSLLHALFSWPSYDVVTCFDELLNFVLGTGSMKFHMSKDGTLPLQMAIRSRQQPDIIRSLFPKNTSLWNFGDRRQVSRLHDAVTVRFPQMTSIYNAGPQPRRTRPPAAIIGDLASLDILLAADSIDVNVRDEQGHTPLITALSSGEYGHHNLRTKLLKTLVQSGADVDIFDDEGCTALYAILRQGSLEELEQILSYKPNIFAQNKHGDTAFHYAIAINSPIGLLRMLLDHARELAPISSQVAGKLSVLELRNKFGFLPFHVACEKENREAVQLLLDMSYVPDVSVRVKKTRRSPLHFVARWWEPSIPILLDLIGRGADVNAVDVGKRTPLMEAAAAGHLQVLKLLVESGARTTAKSMLGYTPWMCAAMAKHSEAMAYLKEGLEMEPEEKATAELAEPDATSINEEDSESSSSGEEDDAMPETGPRQAMRRALRSADEDFLKSLLETGTSPEHVMSVKDKEAPLHRATKPEVSKFIISLAGCFLVLEKSLLPRIWRKALTN